MIYMKNPSGLLITFGTKTDLPYSVWFDVIPDLAILLAFNQHLNYSTERRKATLKGWKNMGSQKNVHVVLLGHIRHQNFE